MVSLSCGVATVGSFLMEGNDKVKLCASICLVYDDESRMSSALVCHDMC
jgi:hypothetical protein